MPVTILGRPSCASLTFSSFDLILDSKYVINFAQTVLIVLQLLVTCQHVLSLIKLVNNENAQPEGILFLTGRSCRLRLLGLSPFSDKINRLSQPDLI